MAHIHSYHRMKCLVSTVIVSTGTLTSSCLQRQNTAGDLGCSHVQAYLYLHMQRRHKYEEISIIEEDIFVTEVMKDTFLHSASVGRETLVGRQCPVLQISLSKHASN